MRWRLVARFLTGAMTLGLVAGGLAACGGDEPDDDFVLPGRSPSSSSSSGSAASPTPGLSPEEAAAVEEIRGIYNGFRDLLVEMYADPDFESYQAPLAEYATGSLHTFLLADLREMDRRGMIRDGEPTSDPSVDVQLDGAVPSATIWDCVDATNWSLVDRDTGEELSEEGIGGFSGGISAFPADLHVMTFDATRYDDPDGWLLDGGRIEEDEQC